jgi:hypothetical protein
VTQATLPAKADTICLHRFLSTDNSKRRTCAERMGYLGNTLLIDLIAQIEAKEAQKKSGAAGEIPAGLFVFTFTKGIVDIPGVSVAERAALTGYRNSLARQASHLSACPFRSLPRTSSPVATYPLYA